MQSFLAVIDPPQTDPHDGLGSRAEQALCASGWRVILRTARARVLEAGAGGLGAQLNGGDIVIGDAFLRWPPAVLTTARSRAAELDVLDRARLYRDGYWGRFIAILVGRGGQIGVYRDPSGALDPFVWSVERSVLIASELPDALPGDTKPKLGIDWDCVSGFLARPQTIHGRSGLDGIVGLAPGGLVLADGQKTSVSQLWRPSSFVESDQAPFETHAAALRESTDQVLESFAGQRVPALAECSGGFDSAVTATGLVASGQPLKALLNYAVEDPGGDERNYAKAVADHMGVPLEISFKNLPDLSPAVIGQVATGFRPSLGALDEAHEAAVLKAAAAVDVERIFTGHGGDSVFFQLTTPLVLRDRVLRSGVQRLSLREVGRLARWSRRSAYSVLAIATGLRRPFGPINQPAWIPTSAQPDHPWLEGLDGVGPAKRFQILSLLQSLDRIGRSRLDGRLDTVHPLMAQPILETALRIPTDLFVAGGRGRALARASFHDRLPSLTLARRSKGELGAFYARAFVQALPKITPFLTDGLLAQRGLLNVDRLWAALDEDALAQAGGFPVILRAVAIEAWVRHWSSRIGANA